MTPGSATADGTRRYQARFDGRLPQEHFRRCQDLRLSSIGIGTYLGDHDDETDRLYRNAIIRAVETGCNVIDTAINYRCQRSERAVGAALKELAARGFGRDEIIIATKGGFIPFDAAPPADVRNYFEAAFVRPGIAGFGDVVAGCHCMTPSYLSHQIERSLENLEVQIIDIYYLHNPETQLGKIPRDEFNTRVLRAFEALEKAVSAGKIRMYGTATWNGYRSDPAAKDYLSMAAIAALAAEAGGKQHHFKVVQLPLSLGMTEALSAPNQPVSGRRLTALAAAQELGLSVMCSASVLQAQLTRNLPSLIGETFQGLDTDAQRALQFVRSTPGVTTALVGMKQLNHVDENMATAHVAPTPWEQYCKLFEAQ